MIQLATPSEHLDASVLADIRSLSVPGEDVLAEVTNLFLTDVPEQLLTLTRAIDACDLESTWRIAHRVKGTALGIGARQMARISGMVEYAARAQAPDRVAVHAAELAIEFESTCLALQQEVRA